MVEAVADSVGRSIHLTPDGKAVSFIHKAGESDWRIDRLGLETGQRRTIVETRPGSEDFIWTPDGHILMAEGSALYLCSTDTESPAWRRIADLGDRVTEITRLAMSSDSKHLAVVGARPETDTAPERESHRFSLERSLDE